MELCPNCGWKVYTYHRRISHTKYIEVFTECCRCNKPINLEIVKRKVK